MKITSARVEVTAKVASAEVTHSGMSSDSGEDSGSGHEYAGTQLGDRSVAILRNTRDQVGH